MYKMNTKGSTIECLVNKKISVILKINEKVEGILVGFDQFLNLVLDKSTLSIGNEKKIIGIALIRGSNMTSIEQY